MPPKTLSLISESDTSASSPTKPAKMLQILHRIITVVAVLFLFSVLFTYCGAAGCCNSVSYFVWLGFSIFRRFSLCANLKTIAAIICAMSDVTQNDPNADTSQNERQLGPGHFSKPSSLFWLLLLSRDLSFSLNNAFKVTFKITPRQFLCFSSTDLLCFAQYGLKI